jgi:DNA repair exonuclease SbcCD ATPase subunit
MSKMHDILNLLDEEFASDFSPVSFKKISAKVVEIANTKGSPKIVHYVPDVLEKINRNKEVISDLNARIEILSEYLEENQALEEKRADLEAKHKELLDKKQQIDELKQKETELNNSQSFIDSFPANLQQINGNIDATINSYVTKLTDLQKILSDGDLENKLNLIIETVQSNLQKIKEEQIEGCLKELDKLETKFTEINNLIDKRIEEHNTFAIRINNVSNAFNTASEKLKNIQEAYKKHIETDKEILNNLDKKGEFIVDGWMKSQLSELDKLLENIENKIKRAIDERAKLLICEILKRQGNAILVEK